MMMKSTTAQQVNTLLYYLQSKQTPPFEVLFWSNLQKIDFDYSDHSIQMLSRFFSAMSTRQFQLADLLASQSGQAFVVAVAAYIADYLAKITGQPIEWYDFDEITAEVARQKTDYLTYLQLPASFECSLTARIGQKVYCQPLKLLPNLLNGDDVLSQFIAEMTQNIHQLSQVNLLQSPDDVCRDYLAKVKNGKLHDASIGLFAYVADIKFDYSRDSLAQIDTALSAIKQDFSLNREDYLQFVQDPARQAFCYLLGFYIGVTSSRLANTPVRWVSFEQMYESLGDEFTECIEHSFVLLFEDGYRTPMLVVTNRLFELAKGFPTTTIEFADILKTQNPQQIRVYPYQTDITGFTDLPTHWLTAIQATTAVIASMLARLSQKQPVIPTIYQTKLGDDLSVVYPSNIQLLLDANTNTDIETDTDKVIDELYQTLHQNPHLAAIVVGCFDSYVNLPMGRTEGIVIEIRVHDAPALHMQLILPYQLANNEHSLILYPLVSHQNFTQGETHLTADQLNKLAQYFYQTVINSHSTDESVDVNVLWQDAFVNRLDFWAMSPKDQVIEQQKSQLVEKFDFPIIPLSESDTNINSQASSQLVPFDYATINWRGFDLSKQILQLMQDEQSYLQVFAYDSLIRDELYRQAEATDNLYRYGKVVWGVVIASDDELTKPISEDERDKPFANHNICSADILFDPTGQATVEELQIKANQLLDAVNTIHQLPNSLAASDVAFYQLHLQDDRSRVFNLAFPPSISDVHYSISSTWIWRRHLPNGILSNRVVPIIINSRNAGEIMVLPSKLWEKTYYQYWLTLAYQQFGQDYDLLPYLNWQQKYGDDGNDISIQKRLFPKSKQPQKLPVESAKDLSVVASERLPTKTETIWSKPLPSDTTESPNVTAHSSISDEIRQQLMADKLRLQTQLSTQDKDKEKKLMMIFGSVLMIIIFAVILVKLIR